MNTCEPFTLQPCPTEQLAHVTFYDPYGRTVLVCTTTLSNDPSWTGPTAHEQNETNESNETRRDVNGRTDIDRLVDVWTEVRLLFSMRAVFTASMGRCARTWMERESACMPVPFVRVYSWGTTDRLTDRATVPSSTRRRRC